MSICRWSSDNFKCDVYIYYGDGGYVIHYAAAKHKGEVPKVGNVLYLGTDEFKKQLKKQNKYFKNCTMKPLDVKFELEDKYSLSLGELKKEVKRAKVCGYRVPDFIFRTLDELEDDE